MSSGCTMRSIRSRCHIQCRMPYSVRYAFTPLNCARLISHAVRVFLQPEMEAHQCIMMQDMPEFSGHYTLAAHPSIAAVLRRLQFKHEPQGKTCASLREHDNLPRKIEPKRRVVHSLHMERYVVSQLYLQDHGSHGSAGSRYNFSIYVYVYMETMIKSHPLSDYRGRFATTVHARVTPKDLDSLRIQILKNYMDVLC